MAYRKTDKVVAMLAAKREAFIDAAIEIVERDGIEALTVDRVAVEAGTSVGGLYKHFPDKTELWAAVVARVLQSDLEAMQAASEVTGGTYAQLHAAVVALYRRFTRRRLREALFADPNYCAGLHRALRPMIADCVGEADSRVALAPAIFGALAGHYRACGQAQGAAVMLADFVLQGIGANINATAIEAAR